VEKLDADRPVALCQRDYLQEGSYQLIPWAWHNVVHCHSKKKTVGSKSQLMAQQTRWKQMRVFLNIGSDLSNQISDKLWHSCSSL